MVLLLASRLLLAHDGGFEVEAVSVLPGDPDQVWAIVGDHGVAWTMDGGQRWTWACHEALGATRVYDVLALEEGVAVLAMLDGPVRVDASGAAERWPGSPEDTVSVHLARTDDGFLVGGIGESSGGIWSCDAQGCSTTSLQDPTHFPKSIRRGPDGWYATVVTEGTLAASLWWSDDGTAWEQRYTWPEGDMDPRVLHVGEGLLLVWLIPRNSSVPAELLRSEDGGATFEVVLEELTDIYREAAIVATESSLVLGDGGYDAFRSTDQGWTWISVTEELPVVTCADSTDGLGVVGADHLVDGFDVATSRDGLTWTPIACLETAVLAAATEESCASVKEVWESQAALGGGRCDAAPELEAAPAEEGCAGCAGGANGAAILLFPAFLRRRKAGRGRVRSAS